ncbi:MAG: ribbon-helix-helix domain-containing protein [Dehalococcoidia bacterium]|nr:ribbon-helix-helix domain-containing protein [Dehalococcoidia bacterium]
MGRTEKLTVTLPKELISVADRIAEKEKISRSKVIAHSLEELAEKLKVAEMAEGYKVLAVEQRAFAAMAAGIANEVLPEWK